VDLVEGLEVPAGVAQLLEALAALRTGEHEFGDVACHHKFDGIKGTGGVVEYGDEVFTKETIYSDLGRTELKWFLYRSE